MTAHKSVIIWTQSASGKTGAFLIPAMNHVLGNPLEDHRHARVLILTSRRDRVNQINYTIKRLLGDGQQIRSGFIVSGRPYQPQMRLLRRPLDLMIATPGRLNDLVDNNKADFSKLEMLIIDDLSAIYHKGLHGLINKILSERSSQCPIIAFVRKEDAIARYTRTILAGAEELEIEDDRNPLLQIPQVVHLADDYTHKIALMDHLLDEFAGEPTVIFTTTSKAAKALAESLSNHGHSADVAADIPANERNGETSPILIYADQDGLTPQLRGDEHVINFELPAKVADYEARLRDLATATREEAVIAIVLPRERENLKLIEESLGDSIEQCNLPGLAPLEHTSGSFTPTVRSPRSHRENDGRGQRNQGGGATRGGSRQHGANNGRNTPNQQGRGNHNPRQGRNPEQRPSDDRQAVAGSAGQRQQRKGPYGRLNGGAQRKRASGGNGGGEVPRPYYHNHPRPNTGTRGDNDGAYEIGSWEKPNYAPQQPAGEKAADDKKVVIRYKEKRRIVTQ